jgi:transposase
MCSHQLAGDLIADVRDLDRRIAAVEAHIKAAVAQSKTTLVELFGAGPVLAAKLLGEVGDISRPGQVAQGSAAVLEATPDGSCVPMPAHRSAVPAVPAVTAG